MNLNPSLSTSALPVEDPRAGILYRSLATIIDLLIMLVPTLLIVERIQVWMPGAVKFVYRLMMGALPSGQPEGIGIGIRVVAQLLLSFTLVGAIYFLSEVFVGQTLGKWLLRLRVDVVESGLSPLVPRLGRYAAKQAGAFMLLAGAVAHVQSVCRTGEVVLYVTLLGCLAVFAPRRQALHDLVSGTVVHRRLRPTRTASQAAIPLAA
jgi:uncharacterized RDD family membrane protein YckC